MKTQQTKDMEQALIRDALRKGKHPALEVPYAHTIDIGHGTYWPEGQWEYIDAVIEEQGMFTCLELKVSISDLHSKAAQSYIGKIKYRIPNNDWITLAKGMILELSNYMKENLLKK